MKRAIEFSLLKTPGGSLAILVAVLVVVVSCFYAQSANAQYFIRGDINADGVVNDDDMCQLQCYLYGGATCSVTGADCLQPPMTCPLAADVDDIGPNEPNSSDLLYLVRYLHISGPPPLAPFPNCGPDPTNPQPGLSCCGDFDNDGVPDAEDNCPNAANCSQSDWDGDGIGDNCDLWPTADQSQDSDGDGVPNAFDVCPGGDDLLDVNGIPGIPDDCEDNFTCGSGEDNDLDGWPGGVDCDRDDYDQNVYPGHPEYCDARDNNCNGITDEYLSVNAPLWYFDDDGDGHGDPAAVWQSCISPGEGWLRDGDDCSPCDDQIHPGATEIPCNGIDENCDGIDSEPGDVDTDGDGTPNLCDECTDIDGDGYGDPGFPSNTCSEDNCPFFANPGQEDGNGDGVGDLCSASGVTDVGTNVAVPLGALVTVSFGEVTGAGTTELTVTAAGPEAGTFWIMPETVSMYFNVSTTASYSGIVEICIYYGNAGITPEDEENIAMMHSIGYAWGDITFSVDPVNDILCGRSTSLSPFVVAIMAVCGDANADAIVDISDAVYLIAYIFAGGPAPDPLPAGDASCDQMVDISDAVYLIAYIFGGGLAPCAGC